jgi:uncharacterized tellurite resistance protein B-like protein
LVSINKNINMDTITFDKLLLQTAFCCMASDGHIDTKEITMVNSLCEKSPFFENFNFQNEINELVVKINANSKEFIKNYFDILKTSELSEKEELAIVDFAIQTIYADDQVEYSEIKFFKNIRHRLKISDEAILSVYETVYPDIEMFLEQDIITETFLEKITSQYLDSAELPQFNFINIISNSPSELKKDDSNN